MQTAYRFFADGEPIQISTSWEPLELAADPSYRYSADGLPYGYDIQQPDVGIDPEELQLVERAIGVRMRCDILFHIFVSDLAGRPALARMAQHVARRTEGRIFVELSGEPPEDLVHHLAGAGRCIRVDNTVTAQTFGKQVGTCPTRRACDSSEKRMPPAGDSGSGTGIRRRRAGDQGVEG